MTATISPGSKIEISPLSPALGAQISGLDLTQPLDEPTADRLRDLLAQYSVLRFRGQELTAEDQVRVISYFGSITPTPAGVPYSFISNKEEGASVPYGKLPFHSDLFWTDNPLEVTSLYGLELEQPVEATTFASTLSAYNHLDADLRQELGELIAFNMNDASAFRKGEQDPTIVHIEREGAPPGAEHPVVISHPRSGAPMLSVSEMMTKEILGVSPERNEQLLDALFEALCSEQNLFVQEWELQDLVIWDNYGAQHGRPNVAKGGKVRTLRKVNAGGETPRFQADWVKATAAGQMM